MVDSLEYNDIFKEDRGSLNAGRLKFNNNQILFKNNKTGKVDQLTGSDVDSINWQRMSNGFGLRVMLKNGRLFRFEGFVESDFEKLNTFTEHNFEVTIEPKEFCLKGWNWGQANFHGADLSFDIEKNNAAFDVPLRNVSKCTTAKNEVTLEFHQNDDAAVSLMELRFHIPTQSETIDDPVQSFMDAVLSKASVIQATGDAIATFSELQCLTPRGRYDIKIFPAFVQLHGKTFDYKIPLSTVLRLFRLPHKDGRQVFFVLSLDPPIKQGQTRYHFLILLFNKENETRLELSISEQEIAEKYEGKLEKTMSGSTVDVLGQVMKTVVERRITAPSLVKNPAITCSYRAGAGLLYPLERGFIYVHKPPVHIRFDEIVSINFARSGGSTRSFDFEVETKSGLVHNFSSIEKEEYSKLYDFVTGKKLRVKNRGTETPVNDAGNDELIDSDIEDEPDAYLARVKQEGKIRAEEGDSDSSDVSFNPGEMGDSDVAEEFDSNASESESSNDEEQSERKEKKSKKPDPPPRKPHKEKKVKKDRKQRSKKKPREEGKPKRPMSAYFLWLNENRAKLNKDHPNLVLTELTKKAAEIWRELGDKTEWEAKAKERKKVYEIEMAEFKANGPAPKSPKSPKNKRKEKTNERSNIEKKKGSPIKTVKSGDSTFKSKEYISDSDSSSSEDDKKSKKHKVTKQETDEENISVDSQSGSGSESE